MFEEAIVYCVVVGAALYATWRLMPATLRFALGELCAKVGQRFGLATVDSEASRRRASKSGGCGGCSGCAGKPTPQQVVIRK